MKRSERSGKGSSASVLVVDDEPDIRELLELTLVKMGLEVVTADSIAAAKARLEEGSYGLCLTDMRLPDGDGLELVRYITRRDGSLPVAVITAYGSAENAVAALKAGAFDYVAKPVALEQLRALVRSALSLPEVARTSSRVRDLIGESAPLVRVRELIRKLARTQAPVHITGESGSGKELAARLIHENGARRDAPFVAVNCGAIPDALMESEFFGYRKGAFTGADQDRDGFFQAASGGTLFLDEVADLPLAMQVKLLRAIQEKRVRKIGATQEDPVDVRIICATHQDLAKRVETGQFRQDLFYRLNVIELRMPSLRECREDIPRFAHRILAGIAAASGGPAVGISQAALERLASHDFPGNIRELENILERSVALSAAQEIRAEDLHLRAAPAAAAPAPTPEPVAPAVLREPGESLEDYLARIERETILAALAKTAFNRTAAARLLGVSFRQLRYRMQRLGIREPGTGSGGTE